MRRSSAPAVQSSALSAGSSSASPSPVGRASSASTAAATPSSWSEIGKLLGAALLTYLVWRGSLYLFDLVGLSLTPQMGHCRPNWQVFGKGHEFLNGFFRWDSGWYMSIANDGYRFRADKSSSVAFYPLLPYLSRSLGKLLGGPAVAGLVITNVALVGSIFYLRRLGTLLLGEAVAKRATLLFLIFPTSFFLSAFYTEALFSCLAIGSMFHYFRGAFLRCGVLGFFAMLARSTGMVLFCALALDLAWRLLRRRERFQWRMCALLLIPAGLGAFMLLLHQEVGDAWAFSKTQHFWGRRAAWPWESVVDALAGTDYGFKPNFGRVQRFIDAACALGFLVLGAAMAWARAPLALWAFVLLGVLVPLATYVLGGMNRYVLGLFPAFLYIAHWCEGRPNLERWLFFSFSFFLAIYSLRFMQCGWAG